VFEKVLPIFLAALTLALLGAAPSKALEEPKIAGGVLVLEGKIDAGDCNTLRKFLSDKSTFDKISGGVFLASPGGNLQEAAKIGSLIRSLGLSTSAPSGPPTGRKLGESRIRPENLRDPNDYLCTSACFLLFVAGIYRDLNWSGRLGIHRPTSLTINLKKPSESQQALFDERAHRAVEAYLRAMNVRIKYLDLMFSTPSSDVRWITQDELDADLQGFIPELRDEAAARCAERMPVNSSEKIATATREPHDIARCEAKALAQLRADLPGQSWPKVFGGK
jgi:hypothetical protein